MVMASHGRLSAGLGAALLLIFFLRGAPAVAAGVITCERLAAGACAFAVSSAGDRCVLEKETAAAEGGVGEEYVCRTSAVRADVGLAGRVETDECVEACGLERTVLGISSDSLFDLRFTKKLCSRRCYRDCPNVVDLYYNLAAGEGVFLPKLCQLQNEKADVRRAMAEMRSSWIEAAAPGLAEPPSELAEAPAPLPE